MGDNSTPDGQRQQAQADVQAGKLPAPPSSFPSAEAFNNYTNTYTSQKSDH